MIRKTTTNLQFASLVTSRNPPQPELSVVVRGVFRIVPRGAATEVGDILEQGFISGHTWPEDDPDRLGEPLCADDLAPFKPHAEVLMCGAICHARGGKPTTHSPVSIGVGDWRKDVVVFGDRQWKEAAVGRAPSEPAPFTAMPLGWERAFGGPKVAANPVGRNGAAEWLPNVEVPERLINSPGDSPAPAGFGPVNPEWPVRSKKRGRNYGAEWARTRSPWFSDDFDWTFFQSAAPDQWLSQMLRGDEDVKLLNLHPAHDAILTRLPGVKARAFVNDVNGNFREVPLELDTVVLLPEKMQLVLNWRGLTPVQDRDADDITILYVDSEPLDAPRDLAEYEALTKKWEADPVGLADQIPPEFQKAIEFSKQAQDSGATGMELAGGSEPNPLSALLAGSLGGMAGTEQVQVQQFIQDLPATSVHVSDGGVNGMMQTAMDQGPLIPPPPVTPPATYGVIPRVPLAKQWKQGKELMDDVKAKMPVPDKLDAMKEMLGDPGWAKADPALAGSIIAFRAENGMPPVKGLEEPPAPAAPAGTAAAVAGAGAAALALARMKAGLVPPPGTVAGVPLRPSELHGPLGPEWGEGRRVLIDEDLSHLDLTHEDFSGVTLYGCNFSGSVLRGVSFRGANLEYACLYQADCTGCDFTGANLYMVMADSAVLVNAKLNDCNVEVGVFNKANLTGASLTDSFGPFVQFQEAVLSGATARNLHAPGASFDKARMTGAQFTHCTMPRASLNQTQAGGCDFSDSDLTRLSAPDALLARVSFARCRIDGSNFSAAGGEGVDFTAASLREAFLPKARLAKAVFEWADMRGARMRRAVLDFAKFGNCCLVDAELAGASCVDTDFGAANLLRCALFDATLSNCNFTGSNVQRALVRAS